MNAIPYLSVFLSLLIFSFPLIDKEKGKVECLYNYSKSYCALLLLIIFIGFRGLVGTDWGSYLYYYDQVPSYFEGHKKVNLFLLNSSYSSWEYGFLVYTILCKTVSSNYFIFQAISSIIDIIILYYFFKKYIDNLVIMGFIVFFLFSGIDIEFNALRNSKALMLFLISIHFIEKKRIIPYIGLNLFGCLFHISSIIYIPFYFILNRRYSKYILLVLIVFGNIVYLLSIKWMKQILDLVNSFFPSRLSMITREYLVSDFFSKTYGISFGFFERNMSFIIFYLFHDKLVNKKGTNIIFINSLSVYWLIYLYCSELYIIPQRVSLLFVFSYWVLYPQIYGILKKKEKYIFIFIVCIYAFLKFFLIYDQTKDTYESAIIKLLS